MAKHTPSGGDRDFLTIFKTGSVDRDDYPDLTEHLLEGRTQLASETGYLMKFGDVSHRGLTPFDVASLHDVPAYPLPEAALESLPAHVDDSFVVPKSYSWVKSVPPSTSMSRRSTRSRASISPR